MFCNMNQQRFSLSELSERSGDVGWISYQANALVGNELGQLVEMLRIPTQPPIVMETCLIIAQKWSSNSILLRDGFLESGSNRMLGVEVLRELGFDTAIWI